MRFEILREGLTIPCLLFTQVVDVLQGSPQRIWDGGYYDMKTIEPTEKGIIETFLSVHWKELIEEGNNII
jgi:hypothetical protein